MFVDEVSGLGEDFVFNYTSPASSSFERRRNLHGLWKPCVMEQVFVSI